MMSSLYRLVFIIKVVSIPVLAPAGDGFHGLLFEFLFAITEIEKDFSIVGTKTADHEHDSRRCAHEVTGEGKLVKELSEIFFIGIRGFFSLQKSLGKKLKFLEHLGLG